MLIRSGKVEEIHFTSNETDPTTTNCHITMTVPTENLLEALFGIQTTQAEVKSPVKASKVKQTAPRTDKPKKSGTGLTILKVDQLLKRTAVSSLVDTRVNKILTRLGVEYIEQIHGNTFSNLVKSLNGNYPAANRVAAVLGKFGIEFEKKTKGNTTRRTTKRKNPTQDPASKGEGDGVFDDTGGDEGLDDEF